MNPSDGIWIKSLASGCGISSFKGENYSAHYSNQLQIIQEKWINHQSDIQKRFDEGPSEGEDNQDIEEPSEGDDDEDIDPSESIADKWKGYVSFSLLTNNCQMDYVIKSLKSTWNDRIENEEIDDLGSVSITLKSAKKMKKVGIRRETYCILIPRENYILCVGYGLLREFKPIALPIMRQTRGIFPISVNHDFTENIFDVIGPQDNFEEIPFNIELRRAYGMMGGSNSSTFTTRNRFPPTQCTFTAQTQSLLPFLQDFQDRYGFGVSGIDMVSNNSIPIRIRSNGLFLSSDPDISLNLAELNYRANHPVIERLRKISRKHETVTQPIPFQRVTQTVGDITFSTEKLLGVEDNFEHLKEVLSKSGLDVSIQFPKTICETISKSFDDGLEDGSKSNVESIYDFFRKGLWAVKGIFYDKTRMIRYNYQAKNECLRIASPSRAPPIDGNYGIYGIIVGGYDDHAKIGIHTEVI
jgi:hypothetical protein